ncbi:hypothetical protein EOM09_06035 [bacterium]|nr:hypothetical protein [bacterium]
MIFEDVKHGLQNYHLLKETMQNLELELEVIQTKMTKTGGSIIKKPEGNPDRTSFLLGCIMKKDRIKEKYSAYNYYLSNNFKWENNFAKQNILNTSLSYFSNNIDVDLSYFDIKNCIYMDVLARPKQLSFSTSIFSASVKTKFDLGNFNINNNILYHKLPEIDVFRYPALQDVLEVSWGKKIFKSALTFRLGFDVIWNSSYYANAYMPATGFFYLQNERKIGNYPYGDVFINLRIKRARIFIKYQHFNNGWSSPAYYSSLHYPSSESSFKIGVSWFFYN